MRWKTNPNLIPPGILLRPYRTKETDWLTVKELCRRAGIPYRVSGGKTLWVAIDPLTVEHFRGLNSQGETVYVVGGERAAGQRSGQVHPDPGSSGLLLS